MKEKIERTLVLTQTANSKPNSHWLLPHVIRSLEVMLQSIHKKEDPISLVREARGLGRIISDDYLFSESELGGRLLDIVNDILSSYDVMTCE